MILHAALEPTTILLVEDNPVDARQVRDCLRDIGAAGIRLEHVASLAEALERIARRRVDAVLLDLGLPDSDGMESFAAVKDAAPDDPIIIISGLNDREMALHAVAAGAQDYLVKGVFDGPALVRVIHYAVQRRRAERAIDESHDRFRALVENGNDGIGVFNAAGVLTYCSPSTRRILGYDPERLVGLPGLDLVRESDRANVVNMLRRARANPGEGFVGRASLRHADGSWRLIEATVTNMLASPAVRGVVFNYRDVTEQKQAADLVQWLSVAVDQGSTAVMMTDASGRVEYVNQRFVDDSGYAAAEMIGKPARLLRAPGYDALYDEVWQAIAAGETYRGEVPCLAKGGRVYWCDMQIWFVRDTDGEILHLVSLQVDVTARREMDARLRETNARLAESAERFRLLSEVTFDGIAIIRDGRVIEANTGLTRLLGVEREAEIVGRQWTEFVSVLSRGESEKRLRGGTEGTYELQLRRTDGCLLYAEATVRRHMMGERAVQVMAVRDLTDKRAVEDRLRQAQKMEAVGQLAGGVAHDFNNILAAILMSAELALLDEGLSAQLREDIETVHAAAKRGADITRQLLTFSRKQVSMPVAVDLTALLDEMQPLLGQLVMATTPIETVHGATRGVEADPIQLEQVILNLVVNARDAMPDGGAIRVETRDVDVLVPSPDLALLPGHYVLVAVSDTGTGIEDSVRARLFEPFFTTKPPGKGTGLGLSTVAGIVRGLEGAIRVDSTLGRGSTFEVYLPALATAAQAPARVVSDAAARGRETILVVEDEMLVRTSICRILNSLGYTTIEAKNGRDALLMRSRYGGQVDLVVTDVMMPEMTGPEMLAELRRTQPRLPAVVVSGYNDSMLGAKALPPSTAFVPKPFTSRALAAKVRELIDRPSA